MLADKFRQIRIYQRASDDEPSHLERQSTLPSPTFFFGIREPKWLDRRPTDSAPSRLPKITSRIGKVVAVIATLVFLCFAWQGFQALSDVTTIRVIAKQHHDSSIGPAEITAGMSDHLYPNKLGKRLVILDVDTRPWRVDSLKDMSQLSYGRLNHYLYAKMHGYDYKFVQAPAPPKGTHATWVKIEAIQQVLQEGYKFVVFTDSDVMFPHLRLPMEYMLTEWNVTSEIAVTAGYAPDEKEKYDHTHHRRMINSGFMVVQDTPVTAQLLKDWIECPTNVKYPTCSDWKDVFWHEQSAWSELVRYDYLDHVREVACNDVNGAPEHQLEGDKKCTGKFVRHYWIAKDHVKQAVQESISAVVVPDLMDDLSKFFALPAETPSG
ncbi:hypothetical protein BDZ85DRAFT_78407 [Elsinoe ampelina]|uniref:Nucleotide-diphospho-sugar transferase domain-containing protein n=1 Tax=Elsinoe ampelina TaxID=302913 RepID=A0A6A6FYU5_9PEZI|nr:hypothetical protein BDZ85DRAFT_78407 [Elsinoe ampelina]